MPHLARLMNGGCVSATWPSFPTCSAANWTTFATGADPQVHGVLQGACDLERCQADTLWHCLQRAGRRVIALNWPGAFSRSWERHVVVGDGRARDGFRAAQEAVYTLTPLTGPAVFGPELRGTVVALRPPEGWLDPPDSAKPPLACELPVPLAKEGEPAVLHVLVTATGDRGYDRVWVCPTRDADQALAVRPGRSALEVGAWSEPVLLPAGEGVTPSVACRFRLIELQPDASRFLLFRSAVYPLHDFLHPEGLADDLRRQVGPYAEVPGRLALGQGWHDLQEEQLAQHTAWLTGAAKWLMGTEDWDLCAVQCSVLDALLHELWTDLDPQAPEHQASRADRAWQVVARTMARLDRMIGELAAALPPEAVVAVVSDHGHVGNYRAVNLTAALEREGLVILTPEGGVDVLRSPVIPGPFHVRVRLEDRDEAGIVRRSDYESVRHRIMDALLAVRDPGGGHAVQLALRREEAGWLGVDHPSWGDVVFALAPGYVYRPQGPQPNRLVGPPQTATRLGAAASAHTQYLPSARLGIGTMEGFCCFAGAGVKSGVTRPRPIWLRDVAPTLLHLLGCPPPADATGRVVTEFLE